MAPWTTVPAAAVRALSTLVTKEKASRRDTDVEAGGDDLVTGLEARIGAVHNLATQVDAAHAGKAPDDLARPGSRQRILVVDAGVMDADGHLASVELLGHKRTHAADNLAVLVLVDHEGLEGGHADVSCVFVAWP